MKKLFNYKWHNKKAEYRQHIEYQILGLENSIVEIEQAIAKLNSKLDTEKLLREKQERERQRDKTRYNKADKYRIVVDPENGLTSLFINGKQMYGVTEYTIDCDGERQDPLITLSGHGSIEQVIGHVEDFEVPHGN